MAGLNERQKRFCNEYIIDLNATQAAIRSGYSRKTARAIAQRLLTHVDIQTEIQDLKNKRAERTQIDQDWVVQQYAKIAQLDISDFVKFGRREVPVIGAFGPVMIGEGEDAEPLTKEINYVDFKESSEVDGTMIAEIKQGKDGASVKLLDRMKALEMLGRHLGMFDIKAQVHLTHNYEDMTDEELMNAISRMERELEHGKDKSKR